MPATIKRSSKKAQDTYEETLESAEKEYGDNGGRAHRVAYASLKHSFEKVGDHWEAKKHKGSSDPEAKESGPPSSHKRKPTYGGVDEEGHTKKELLDRAKSLGVSGTSRMTKDELAHAIDTKNKAASRKARGRSKRSKR
ncbi:MAG TPA: ChaB family protein [Candidatus Aquilonibacter sp.]|nr:ChaB family protein [Candidatus Aquilonibacter sp.]